MENSSWSLSVYYIKKSSCSETKKLSKLKCNVRTLGLMKLHGRGGIRCGLCILLYFLVEANKFWYGVLVYVLVHAW